MVSSTTLLDTSWLIAEETSEYSLKANGRLRKKGEQGEVPKGGNIHAQ